jgi:hypothetical protein
MQASRLRTRQVVVDLAGARFWDASGPRTLADFTRELAADGRACRIVGALPGMRRLIGMAGLADSLLLDGPLADCPRPTAAASDERRGRGRTPDRGPATGHPEPQPSARPLRAGAHRG